MTCTNLITFDMMFQLIGRGLVAGEDDKVFSNAMVAIVALQELITRTTYMWVRGLALPHRYRCDTSPNLNAFRYSSPSVQSQTQSAPENTRRASYGGRGETQILECRRNGFGIVGKLLSSRLSI